MEKVVRLKDGTEVLVRPMRADDLERSWTFFQALPEEDREYLRGDVTKRYVVERRIRDIEVGKVRRLVALLQDEIVADGAIELAGHQWTAHAGEMRLIVARPYRRQGLGMVMTRELYAIAAAEKLEQIVAGIARPQVAALEICRKLGFEEEATLSEHVRDRSGKRQDLILMRCNLEALWQELETFFADIDWRRAR